MGLHLQYDRGSHTAHSHRSHCSSTPRTGQNTRNPEVRVVGLEVVV